MLSCSGARVVTTDAGAGAEGGGGAPPAMAERLTLPVLGGEGHPGTGSGLVREELAAMSDVGYSEEHFPGDDQVRGLVESVLRTEGLPTELAALVWIESDYHVGCYSRMGAAGPWQLMRETGDYLGLRIDSEVDQRYGWVTSTRAAARYLRQLEGMFGDWSLAIAAYNCGPGRVQSGMAAGGRTFGEIDLPGETDAFVPRFASAVSAYRRLDEPASGLAVAWVPPGLDLRLLGADPGIDIDTLMSLNREYLRERTPTDGEAWQVVVPRRWAVPVMRSAWNMTDRQGYTVREGDTWSSLAEAFGVDGDLLAGCNPGGSLSPGRVLTLPESTRPPINAGTSADPGYFDYTVRMGDTMGGIAAGVGVSSREVAEWNDMSPDDTIYPGDVLRLRHPSSTPETEADTETSGEPDGSFDEADVVTGGGRVEHTVLEGDTLWDLAVTYDVPLEQILFLNSLEDDNLSIGQVLLIRPE